MCDFPFRVFDVSAKPDPVYKQSMTELMRSVPRNPWPARLRRALRQRLLVAIDLIAARLVWLMPGDGGSAKILTPDQSETNCLPVNVEALPNSIWPNSIRLGQKLEIGNVRAYLLTPRHNGDLMWAAGLNSGILMIGVDGMKYS